MLSESTWCTMYSIYVGTSNVNFIENENDCEYPLIRFLSVKFVRKAFSSLDEMNMSVI